jgi:glc operon protein GlcG
MSARGALWGLTLVLALVLVLTLSGTPGLAQAPSYGPEITHETAKKVATAALAEAVKRKWPVAVAVVDNHGFLVYYERLDDTQTAGATIAVEKARTAAMFRRPSRSFDERSKTQVSVLGIPGATPITGGLPIVVDGKVIGGIGVSGMAAEQDEEIASAGLDALK